MGEGEARNIGGKVEEDRRVEERGGGKNERGKRREGKGREDRERKVESLDKGEGQGRSIREEEGGRGKR